MCVNMCCVPVEIRRFPVVLHLLGLMRIARDGLCGTALGAASGLLWFVLARIVREWEVLKWSSFIPCTSILQGVWQAGPGGQGPKCSSRKPGVLSRRGRNIRNTMPWFDTAAHHALANIHALYREGWYFFLEIRISLCNVLLPWAIWKVL